MNAATETATDGAQAREDLLQLLYLCPVALIRLDQLGDIELMNPYGAQLLMPLATDGQLTNLFTILAPYAPEVGEMATRFAPRNGRICEEHRIVVPARREGLEPTVLSITLQKVDAGLLVAVLSDVTAAAAREALVRTSEERMHAVLNGVREYAICTLDPRGIITSWNRAAERMDDYRSDEMIGRHIDIIVPARAGGLSPMSRRLENALRNGSDEFQSWRVRKDGTRYWAYNTISLLRDHADESILGFSIITRDLTEERRAEDRLKLQATTDPLTGAFNRRSFFETVRDLERPTLILIDADRFKEINDTYGHDAGDATLVRIVRDCRRELRPHDFLARFGGEEFAIVLPDLDLETGRAVAERIRKRIADGSDADVACTVSIGVGRAAEGEGVESLIRRVDAALFAAKGAGRNVTMLA